jgi:hypothetical protein
MATTTYEPIATIAGNGSGSSISFTSIPSTYTDLYLVQNGVVSSDQEWFTITYNNDSSSGLYSYTYVVGSGSSATSFRQSNKNFIAQMYVAGGSTTNPSNSLVSIQNYSNTTTFKTCLIRFNSNRSGNEVGAAVGLWRNTSAISTITLTSAAAIPTAMSFTLYGIANAQIKAPKATGGTITYDNTYFYHTFGASGTFTPQQNLTVDYLVIAGGGAGSRGGGGAGGLRSSVGTTGGGGSLESPLSLTAQAYTVTVGAGGTNSGSPTNGGNSTFSTITSTGGGAGGLGGFDGSGGGSGGGGGGNGNSGGSRVTGQGFIGGTGGGNSSNGVGAGGGGAGAAAATAGSTDSSNGGNGVISPFANVTGTGVATYYAGGGGGASNIGAEGQGGLGGGGAGTNIGTTVIPGVVNTGSGGGANGNDSVGGTGGSGVVIIRYPKA